MSYPGFSTAASTPSEAESSTPSGTATHVVLLPVKPPSRGKSRIVGLAADARARLARAFALDTSEACLATPRVGAVLVVTDDARFSSEAGELGCASIPDGVSDDLNGTLRLAAAEAARRWPDLVPVALCGDLPALRPDDLEAALGSIGPGAEAFVVDALGTGTTLYTARASAFEPRFGVGSAQRHRDAGALAIAGELASLRHDVDDLDDLREVRKLGLGPRTTLAAIEAGLTL
jgi:2-phospho-L-lactate guanylyltransferase